ncbi:MAG: MFS transporter [bacterium]
MSEMLMNDSLDSLPIGWSLESSGEGLGRVLRYRWVIFSILAFSYILVYFHRLCPAVVAGDMMRDLHATGVLLGLLGSAYYYPYALMQLPAGLLADSWGPRKTITTFFAVACAGSLILGWAPSLSWAIFGRTLVGIGVSMLFVPTMKILAEWFDRQEFASMAGILIAMGGVGSITATSPLAYMSRAVGWRLSFTIVGIITLILGILLWLMVRDRPQDMGWPSPLENGADDERPAGIGLFEGVKNVLSYGPFWPLAIWFFFGCAVFFSFIGLWGGPYLMQVYGLSKPQAGNILMMSAFGMVVGSPILSFLSNRVCKGRKPLLMISSFMTVLITAALTFLTDRLPIPGLYLLCFFTGVFVNAIVVIGFTATKELFPVSIAGTSTGLANFFPFLGGALLQPFMGYLLERYGKAGESFTAAGYSRAFMAMFVCAIITFAASIFIKETLIREPLISGNLKEGLRRKGE